MGKGKIWGEEELELLDDLAGHYPLRLITKKINSWHKKNNTDIKRSVTAVKVRMIRLKYPIEATEDNMTISRWARQLNISPHRIRGWTRFSGLQHEKVARNKAAISIKSMKELATERPFLFADIAPEILQYYFGDEITNLILANKPMREKMVGNKPIRRIDTGEVYSGIKEASRRMGMDRATVKREASKNGWLHFVK